MKAIMIAARLTPSSQLPHATAMKVLNAHWCEVREIVFLIGRANTRCQVSIVMYSKVRCSASKLCSSLRNAFRGSPVAHSAFSMQLVIKARR